MNPPNRHFLRTGLYVVAVLFAVFMAAAAVNAVTADAGATTTGEAPMQPLHERFSQQFEIPEGGSITIRNSNGRVTVTGWDGDAVVISVDKRLELLGGARPWFKGRLGRSAAATREQLDFFDAMRLDVRSNEGTLEITGPRYAYSPDVSLLFHIDVLVPRGTDIDVRTENGLVAILDIQGHVRAASANGKVSCENILGNVEARTRNGGIFCSAVEGDLTARTSNGSILVDGRDLATTHALVCRTDNGAIKIHFPRSPSFDLAAQTSNGYVQTDLEVNGRIPGRAVRTVEGAVGAGGPTVELETINGSIYLDES